MIPKPFDEVTKADIDRLVADAEPERRCQLHVFPRHWDVTREHAWHSRSAPTREYAGWLTADRLERRLGAALARANRCRALQSQPQRRHARHRPHYRDAPPIPLGLAPARARRASRPKRNTGYVVAGTLPLDPKRATVPQQSHLERGR